MKEFWNERFGRQEYIYGKEPNAYFKTWIDSQDKVGRILLPAEGEGRNAVYAATLGWDVVAFDQSETGRTKAITLAEELNVSIQYDVSDGASVDYSRESFDAVGLIYAHFPKAIRPEIHHRILNWLKPGGKVVLEGFGQDHLNWKKENPSIGGPDDEELLFSLDAIRNDFDGCEIVELQNEVVSLNEGRFHVGKGAVVRYIGIKK